MKKNCQTTVHAGRTTANKARLDPTQAAHERALRRFPYMMTIAIADLADELEEGLLAFAGGRAAVRRPTWPLRPPSCGREAMAKMLAKLSTRRWT